MKVDIGIIGAMQPEVEAIIASLSDKTCEGISGIEFYTGFLCGKRVAVARCGIGKVFAALCAQTMILKYSPDLLVMGLCILFTFIWARIAAVFANKAKPETLNRAVGAVLVLLGVIILGFEYLVK